LDDTFKSPDPRWGQADAAAAFTPGGLVLKPPVNGSAWRLEPELHDRWRRFVRDGRQSGPAGRANRYRDVGVRFWASDGQNFLLPRRCARRHRIDRSLVNGVWQVVLPPVRSSAVRTSPGAVNEVEIIVNGSTGSFYINDTRITDFHGEAPPRAGPPGVYAESAARRHLGVHAGAVVLAGDSDGEA